MESENMNYPHILGTLKEKIKQAKLRAVLNVNAELLGIHWEIGRMIALQESEAAWGGKTVERLAADLKSAYPDMKGFSSRNLRYMRGFHVAYPAPSILQHSAAKFETEQLGAGINTQSDENQSNIILQQAVAKLPWTHYVGPLSKMIEAKGRVFCMRKCTDKGWSRFALDAQIGTKLHLQLSCLPHLH